MKIFQNNLYSLSLTHSFNPFRSWLYPWLSVISHFATATQIYEPEQSQQETNRDTDRGKRGKDCTFQQLAMLIPQFLGVFRQLKCSTLCPLNHICCRYMCVGVGDLTCLSECRLKSPRFKETVSVLKMWQYILSWAQRWVQRVPRSRHSFRVSGPILSPGYCLCGVLHVLQMST